MLTTDQRNARFGHVTASRFAAVLTEPREKKAREAGKLSGTAKSYMYEIIAEILTGLPTPEVKSYSLDWGNENEPLAIAAYEQATGRRVQSCDFTPHPSIRYVGATPDGLIDDDGLLEAKCPYNSGKHAENVAENAFVKEYYAQVQGQLWVTGRDWCDLISYDPRVSDPALALHIVTLERDTTFINKLEAAVVAFSLKLNKTLELMEGKCA